MPKISKHVSKICHKQANKALKKTLPALGKSSRKRLGKDLISALEQQLPTKLSRQKKLKKPQKKLLKAELQNRAGSWIAANQPSLGQLHSLKPQTGSMSFALRPFKKSPCGGCPALKGKLCRCALKYQQRLQQAG
ncbi:hypothetical protein [Shewanella algae]|uniref:hypothetical protein n=1 Tax=Shewanella algae TaxID=38313 RepID=UPI001AAC8928|nr:hypothetical protein [Shewanella algae]MBO2612544.1 hypothetical protein [Shewanella algae]MBO2624947.1 hypothetical protein [Shewanella algae]BCV27789.1 hypothetical protein TUM3811_16490 [Shewanella algae]BCV49987.1 hypothetical protein TUM17382_26800 [Shewanella algae]BCV54340.1 hypothetical protein TUM17383_25870 [Shewanella algae]